MRLYKRVKGNVPAQSTTASRFRNARSLLSLASRPIRPIDVISAFIANRPQKMRSSIGSRSKHIKHMVESPPAVS
jgi:hypothetical protein